MFPDVQGFILVFVSFVKVLVCQKSPTLQVKFVTFIEFLSLSCVSITSCVKGQQLLGDEDYRELFISST